MDQETNITALQETLLNKYRTLSADLHSLDETIKNIINNKHTDENGNVSTCTPQELLQLMRELEIKMGIAGTLVKGSVYSLILQRAQQEKQQL